MDKACSTAPGALILTPPVVDVGFDVDDVVDVVDTGGVGVDVVNIVDVEAKGCRVCRVCSAHCALILTPLGRNFGHQVATPPFL